MYGKTSYKIDFKYILLCTILYIVCYMVYIYIYRVIAINIGRYISRSRMFSRQSDWRCDLHTEMTSSSPRLSRLRKLALLRKLVRLRRRSCKTGPLSGART